MHRAEIQLLGVFQKGGVGDRRLHWLKTIPLAHLIILLFKEDHKGRLYEWAHLSIKGHRPKLAYVKNLKTSKESDVSPTLIYTNTCSEQTHI